VTLDGPPLWRAVIFLEVPMLDWLLFGAFLCGVVWIAIRLWRF